MKLTILIIFAVVCWVQAVNWQYGDDEQVKWSWNCDFRNGQDITSVKAKAEKYGYHCRQTFNCFKFAWTDYEGGTCWLKKSGDLVETNSGIGGENLKPWVCCILGNHG